MALRLLGAAIVVSAAGDEASQLGRRVLRELADMRRVNEELGRQVAQLTAAAAAAPAVATARDPWRPGWPPAQELFVVTAFGADPTGTNDSTAAIQAAFDASIGAMSQGAAFKYGRVWEPEVRFPSGHYLISDYSAELSLIIVLI